MSRYADLRESIARAGTSWTDHGSTVDSIHAMKIRKSGVAAVTAGGYLLLVSAAASPLVQDGSIHHGNGLAFVLTLALTSPLSYVLLLLTDAFEGLRSSSFMALCELGAGALFNACLIYLSVAFVHRKWWT